MGVWGVWKGRMDGYSLAVMCMLLNNDIPITLLQMFGSLLFPLDIQNLVFQ